MIKNTLRFTLYVMLILGFNSITLASVGVLHKDKSEMFLYEKVGKAENLLDNPARLKNIQDYVICNYFNLDLEYAEPCDPVFKKSTRDDEAGYNVQVIAPIEELLTVNLGHGYSRERYETNSTSSIDGSYFKETAKTLQRDINAGVAADIHDLIENMIIGYWFKYRDQDNPGDYLSDIAQSYTYANNREVYQHKLGVAQEGWGMYASYAEELYSGEYDHNQEVQFLFQTMDIAARKILGEIDGENVSLSAAYSTTILETQQFEIARPVYQLVIPGYKVDLSAYYSYPQPGVSYALGIELDYTDTQYYKPADIVWEHGQLYQAKCPGLLEVEIFPFLRLWVEMALLYVQDTYKGSKSLALENAFGARFQQDIISINLFMVPELNIFSGNQADNIQTFRAGLDAQVNF